MKHCVITGSNRGIGLELVRTYLAKGDWHVHACCRNPEKADALRELVSANLGRVTLHALEVTDGASVEKLGQALGSQSLDLLINNAGIKGSEKQTLDEMDYDAWAETFAVNSMAPLRVTKALLPNLKSAENAKIVTISSQLGAISYGGTGSYAYRSSKAAINMVMTLLGREVRTDGITCVLFHPGWVKTDMGGQNADITVEESAQGIVSKTDSLTIADTGGFFNWNGTTHDW